MAVQFKRESLTVRDFFSITVRDLVDSVLDTNIFIVVALYFIVEVVAKIITLWLMDKGWM